MGTGRTRGTRPKERNEVKVVGDPEGKDGDLRCSSFSLFIVDGDSWHAKPLPGPRSKRQAAHFQLDAGLRWQLRIAEEPTANCRSIFDSEVGFSLQA
jgi:hypothetical protein